jgi:hypothetical protein
VDAELFVPEACFAKDQADQRERVGLPKERTFATKIQLGCKRIPRGRRDGLSFEVLACDALYGEASWFRAAMPREGILSLADVALTTHLAPHPSPREADLIWTAGDLAEASTTVWQRVCACHRTRGTV